MDKRRHLMQIWSDFINNNQSKVIHAFHKKEINLESNVEPKFLRLKHILGDSKSNPPIKPIIPVSKSAWWDGIKKVIIQKV